MAPPGDTGLGKTARGETVGGVPRRAHRDARELPRVQTPRPPPVAVRREEGAPPARGRAPGTPGSRPHPTAPVDGRPSAPENTAPRGLRRPDAHDDERVPIGASEGARRAVRPGHGPVDGTRKATGCTVVCAGRAAGFGGRPRRGRAATEVEVVGAARRAADVATAATEVGRGAARPAANPDIGPPPTPTTDGPVAGPPGAAARE